MITVHGRVRATVRLTANGVDGACVVASSWSSARVFPRTLAAGVTFELETAEGELYTIDPFEAVVVLPVRRRVVVEDTRTEDAWIADGDEVEIEGELQPARGPARPVLLARRLSTPAGGTTHLIPPRSVTRGESERIEAPVAAAPAALPPVVETPTSAPDEPAVITEAAESPASSESEQAPRRPKKKRPDSSGTPTPIQ